MAEETTPPTSDLPEPDRSEPSEERKAELRAAYQDGTEAPYKDVRIKTLGELEWIFVERGWSGRAFQSTELVRPNLREADLRGAILNEADLNGALLNGARIGGAILQSAHLSGAILSEANAYGVWLREADLSRAKLDRADLGEATLNEANLSWATLSRANLRSAMLKKVNLFRATLSEADLQLATLDGANLGEATFIGADLGGSTLEGADLSGAKLSEASFFQAQLRGAFLRGAKLDNADLSDAGLNGVDLTRTQFSSGTTLDGIELTKPPIMLGTRWNGVPLDAVNWSQVTRLGDEEAIGKAKNRQQRVQAYRDAVRAYHGLVIALEDQGLVEPARRFRQRERTLQRRALRASPRTWGAYAFYSLLNLVSGQGEEPQRIFVAYGIIIGVFTAVYWAVSHWFATPLQPALHWYEALVLSLSSFHGRGFFPSQIGLGDPLAIVAAFEAVIGLFIELILIATFSNRFLNK